MGATAPVGMYATRVWVFVSLHEEMKAGVTSTISLKSDVFQSDPLQNVIMAKGVLFQTLFHTITISFRMDLVLVYRNDAYGF